MVKRLITFHGRPAATVGRKRGAAKIAAVVAAIAISGLLPATAFAHHLEPGMSMSISGDIQLVSGVYLAVPVSLTCPALTDPYSAILQDGFGVTVTENVGKTLAYGGGSGPGYQSPVYGYTFGTPRHMRRQPARVCHRCLPSAGLPRGTQLACFQEGQQGGRVRVFQPLCIRPQLRLQLYDENGFSFGPQSIAIK